MGKICTKCKVEKNPESFYSRGGQQKHLLSSWCRDCYKTPEYRSKANIRNKKYENGRRAHFYKQNPLYYLWYVAKKRASAKGLDFTIEPSDIVFDGYCPITGKKLDVARNKLSNSVSLDRVDNTKGYIKGNVVAISRWANLKNLICQ